MATLQSFFACASWISLSLLLFPNLMASSQIFKTQVERVLVDVIAEKSRGGALNREDFQLYVDDHSKDISYFGRDELPLAVALLIDGSRSVAPFFQDLKDAAASLVLGLKLEDRVGIYTATVPTTRVSELTTDRDKTLQALNTFQAMGGSAVVDGIDFAATDLARTDRQVRRVVVVLSDDIDPSSKVPEFQLSRKLIQNEITVFEIKTKSVMPFPMKMHNIAGKRVPFPAITRSASAFVNVTGGKVISLRSRLSARWGRRPLSKGFSELLEILRSRYTLGFIPEPSSHSFHSVRITLRKEGHLKTIKLRYRNGYWDS